MWGMELQLEGTGEQRLEGVLLVVEGHGGARRALAASQYLH